MQISSDGEGEWTLSWAVPLNSSGPYDVELVARDGQYVDDVFVPDGGEDRLRFTLFVRPVELTPPEPVPEPPTVGSLSGGGSGCETSTHGRNAPFWMFLVVSWVWLRRRCFA